jgi:hypothetical protein
MGWDTAIQSTTTSAVLGPPASPESIPAQTALQGHDVKTVPPEGFRQRLVRGIQQFGRRLASICTAGPGDARRTAANTARRSTRTQLESLFKRLGSASPNMRKVGLDLEKLADAKRQWAEQDPQNADQSFKEMVRTVLDQRWPGEKVLELEKALAASSTPDAREPEAREHLASQSLPLPDALVEIVTAKASDYRAVEALKAQHKNAIRDMGFTAAKNIADGIFWKGPILSATLKEYDKATRACEYKPGATEQNLRTARDELELVGDKLLQTLEQEHPKKAVAAAGARYLAPATWKAISVKARNRTQADLYSHFIRSYQINQPVRLEQALQKSGHAKSLLRQVAEDEPLPQPGPRRGPEEQYFHVLRKQRRYLQSATAIKASEGDANMKELKEALERLPTSVDGAGKRPNGEAVNYLEALETLNQAIAAADRKVETLVANVTEQIKQIESLGTPAARAKNALELVEKTDSAILTKLPVQQQVALLKQLRGDLTHQPPAKEQWERFRAAQNHIYRNTSLQPQFLRKEKEARRAVMDELRQDKKMLQEARDLWHTYDPYERRKVLMKIVQAHSSALGCDPPLDIRFTSDPEVKGCLWHPDERTILIGTSSGAHLDFEDIVDAVFHENSHNFQDQLAARVRKEPPGTQGGDPLYDQALLFAANQRFYIGSTPDYYAYRLQPMEKHAYHAGAKFSADLMRMLAS